MDNRVLTALVIIGVGIIVAIVAWAYQRRRTDRLRAQFGPEYDRTVTERADRRRAEYELEARARRVGNLHIRLLDARERDGFAQAWHSIQNRFAEEPTVAVAEADQLITEAMQARGYPGATFEQGAADLSVHHGRAVEEYRHAHEIAADAQHGEASTEELRQAMVGYRALFRELLEEPHSGRETRHERAA